MTAKPVTKAARDTNISCLGPEQTIWLLISSGLALPNVIYLLQQQIMIQMAVQKVVNDVAVVWTVLCQVFSLENYI